LLSRPEEVDARSPLEAEEVPDALLLLILTPNSADAVDIRRDTLPCSGVLFWDGAPLRLWAGAEAVPAREAALCSCSASTAMVLTGCG
jgi:hypothetical protein